MTEATHDEMKEGYQLMPSLSEEEYKALKQDIRERGVLVPVEYDEDGNILDGYHRVRICNELGIEDYPSVIRRDMTEQEKRMHIRSINLARRHLNEGQKAELIKQQLKDTPKWSNRTIARKLGVDDMTVNKYRKELEESAEIRHFSEREDPRTGNLSQPAEKPDKSGEKTEEDKSCKGKDNDAVFTKTKKEREKVQKLQEEADEGDEDAEEELEKVSKGKKTATSAQQTYKRRKTMRERKTPETPEGEYSIVYADPPWRYDFHTSDSRRIENQYPTMSAEEICNLDVPAAENAVLYLWVPSVWLKRGLKVMESWGFEYVTTMVWVKDRLGMGMWARSKHEFILIGKKGTFSPPETDCRPPSVIEAPYRGHSIKPDKLYEIIERAFPEAEKLELFARDKREGWTTWGDEVEN